MSPPSASRYKCPADFVPFTHKPCASTFIDNVCDDNIELWLIKAPSSFDINNLRMPLSRLQTVRAPAQQVQGGSEPVGQICTVLGGPLGAVDLRLLTSHCQTPNTMVCAPAFSGLLNIGESFGDCSTNQAPMAIPATPAPTIPPGLRQRFQPFGSKTPTLSGSVEDTARAPETPLTVMQEPGEERKSKKKKKRDKRLKIEELERVVGVKEERLAMILSPEEPCTAPGQEADLSEERRKRKKKKRDKDRGEAEEGGDCLFNEIKEETIEVKVEPIDFAYGDVGDSGKKKKKKKNKCDD
uniref:Uncharacterized protein n=1 Tax=Esox lucius TaxID=8010 RepID=A0A3P9A072_ESOLU